MELGEEVYRDETNTFRIVYGGMHKIEKHGFVTYTKYRSRWKRVDRNPSFQMAIEVVKDYKERLGL